MKNLLIHEESTIKETYKALNDTAEKVLIVVNNNDILLGTITDGDLRRAILSGMELTGSIKSIYNSNPIFLQEVGLSLEKVKSLLITKKIELIPIVNAELKVVDFITWEKAFSEESRNIIFEQLDVPVVIMAGGKGTRLKPLTNILPKPLLPVGELTIAEHIINQFREFGIKDYFFILNYKGEMIKAYFDSINRDYNLDYIFEDDYYGTAGSLKLISDKLPGTFFVSNCDILVKANYADVLSFHKDRDAAITILSSIQYQQVPYGVIKYGKNGIVEEISEKPEYAFTVNTGVYAINQKYLKYIPSKKLFHMTDFINVLMENDNKVYTYPVNKKDYIDIGQWKDYKEFILS